MTPTEKAIRDFCGRHADWWPSTTQVQAMLALAQQRMAAELKAANKWIKDSEKIIADQTARIVDLQTHIENHVCSQRPWQGLTEKDWEHIDSKKGTALDTFAQGAVWAEVQLRERNT